jgi:scyllo-inositol 2-dehydrogenase (NADP+)
VEQIGVGLAGYGIGGAVFHAPLIRTTSGMRLVAVATSRREQVVRELPDVGIVGSYADLAADPTIGLVVISTPTATHYEAAKAVIEAGKHVVVDKPFTTTVAEAQELIALAAARGVLLSVYQNRRWDGDFLTVERLIREGALGSVSYFESHFDRFRPAIKGGWRDEPGAGSGIWYDLGSHLVDQAIHLFGRPESVLADVMTQRPEAQSIDYFHVVLRYGRMRAVVHGSSLVREPGPHFAVHGDGGSFLKYGMDPQEEALRTGSLPLGPDWGQDAEENYGLLVRADGTRERVKTEAGCYLRFYELMAAAIRGEGPVPVDPAESRDGLQVLEAAAKCRIG